MIQPTGIYSKSAGTIANILDAAEAQFVSHSFDDITLADVATAAGVTKGAIYHHFNNKNHLFLAMMQRYLGALQSDLHIAIESKGSTRDRIEQLTLIFLSLPIETQRVMQLVRRDSHRFTTAERKKLVQAYQNALPAQIECALADGIARKELQPGDARLLARQFVAIVEVGLSDYARKSLGSPEHMAAQLVRLFFDGAAAQHNKAEISTEDNTTLIGLRSAVIK